MYEDRLYPILAPTGQEDCGKLPQRPGDVVQKDVLGAVEDGGPQDGVGDTLEVPQGIFQLALPLEVGQVAPGVGVGDADVDDAADSRLPGGLEHHPGLLNALLVGAAAVVHPDPVGVEEGVGAPEGLGELIGLVEVEGVEGHLVPEGVFPLGVAGDGLNPVSLMEEQLGDVPAGVAGGSGDGVEALRGHVGPPVVGPSQQIIGRRAGLDFGAIDLGGERRWLVGFHPLCGVRRVSG